MIQVLNSDGHSYWSSVEGRELPDHAAIRALLGESVEEKVQRSDVLRAAEGLGFVSRTGAPRGFLNILPRGTVMQARVDAFNQPHIDALAAVRMDFPSIYDIGNSQPLRELTESYESQGRVFHVENPHNEWRLSYAADPGLLSYFAGQIFDPQALPYAIVSPMPAFRRYQSGECGGLDKNRQYDLPDFHILCGNDARETFLNNLAISSQGAKFWEHTSTGIALFIDVVEEFLLTWPSLAADLARAAGVTTLVRTLSSRPRYYSFRAGLVLFTGMDTIMLYNFQWDDTNPLRFGMRRADDGEIILIHATLAGGWPKLLPWAIGRGLTGIGPRLIPPELDSPELTILPVNPQHLKFANLLAANLTLIGRDVQIDDREIALGAKVHDLRQQWKACHIVVGDRESDGSSVPLVESPSPDIGSLPLPTFLATTGPRLDRCSSFIRARRLPFLYR